jgi:cytochrome P450
MQPLSLINNLGNYFHNNIKDPFPEVPGNLKMPFIGSTFDFANDLNKFLIEYWQQYGDIFKVRIFGANFIVMVGPEANQFVLQDEQEHFLSKESWGQLIGELFTGAIMLSDNEEHERFRRIMQTAFHRKPMMSYSKVINDTVKEYIDKEISAVKGPIKFYPLMEKLTLNVAGRLFFGVEFTDQQLNAITAVTRASADPVRLKLPFTKYGKGIQSRKVLEDFYQERIDANKNNPKDDLFSYMCIARSEAGETFTDQEIINQMIFVMMAAHDTTTSTLAAMIYQTAKSPEWQDKMRLECKELNFGDQVPYEGLKDFKIVEQVMNESMRLHPALNAFPRMAIRDFTFNGYKIPAYTYVAISPKLTHLRPDIYKDAFQFDPDRFSEERAEHKIHKHAFIPFGAGNHLCIGKYFAIMEIKTIINHLIQKYSWSVAKDYTTKFLAPLNHPEDGLMVTLKQLDGNN